MRRTFGIGGMVMMLVLALGAIGIGYALWAKVLTIEGKVHTGEVNAVLSIEEVDEGDISLLHDDGINEDSEVEGKNIADCTAELLDGLNNPGPQTLSISITNGYPSFWCVVNFNVENTGTIPIKLEQPVVTQVDPGLLAFFGFSFLTGDQCYFNEVDGTGVLPTDPHPQLEPGEQIFCTAWVHVEQVAEQNADLTFTGSICAHQWNEEPSDPVACLP